MCCLESLTTACKADVHILRVFSLNKCVKKAGRVHVTKNGNIILMLLLTLTRARKEVLLFIPGSYSTQE